MRTVLFIAFVVLTACGQPPEDATEPTTQGPSLEGVTLEQARAFAEAGDNDTAIAAFGRLAEASPEDADLQEWLATLYNQEGLSEEAEHHYREAVRLEPTRVSSWQDLFRLLARTGRYDDSLAAAAEGLEHSPDDVLLRTWYGEALMRLRQRWSEAEAELLEALALPDAGAHPHYVLGLVYLNTGRLDEARTELETATRLDPASPRAWYQLANVLGRLGDDAAEQRALERFAAIFQANQPTPEAS